MGREYVMVSYEEYDSLIDSADKLRDENAELREKLKEEIAENKWAREFLDGIAERIKQANAHSLVNYVETIKDQNAKLRELVRDMFSYAFNREMELCNACVEADGEFSECAACDEYDGACGIAKRRFEELYADRMRELGIEDAS